MLPNAGGELTPVCAICAPKSRPERFVNLAFPAHQGASGGRFTAVPVITALPASIKDINLLNIYRNKLLKRY